LILNSISPQRVATTDNVKQPIPKYLRVKKLALFDFDGTITTKDTLLEFVRFYKGRNRFFFGLLMLTPLLALFIARLIPNWKAKQQFLSHYFKGENISEFNSRCVQFSAEVIPALIRPKALQAISDLKRENVTIAVVSASAENWVKPWCDANGLICLATKLEVKNNMLTGNYEGRNCYGDEKACRIKEHFDVSSYHEIIAFGDSAGDKEMLALAHRGFFKPFRSS
jgi:phosphatidylglycerophosphatase C